MGKVGPRIDLTGQVFGRLEVSGFLRRETGYGSTRFYWVCTCSCGNTTIRLPHALTSGKTKSCGCLRYDLKCNFKHGMLGTGTYNSWQNMKRRCLDETIHNFKWYGGRGIKVCERWMKFENFLEDMGERPEGKSLDRIDNDGDYEPENCRWATYSEQVLNSRTVRLHTFDGVTDSQVGWASRVGITQQLLSKRLSRGWTFEQALYGKK